MNSYKLDPDHSELNFSVKHLELVNTTGRLKILTFKLPLPRMN